MSPRRTLYQDAEVTFLCDYIFELERVALHLNIEKGAWSPSKFKRYRSIFTNVIAPNLKAEGYNEVYACLLYTSPSPRDRQKSRMPSSA